MGDGPTADASKGEPGPDERRAGDAGDEGEGHVLSTVVRIELHPDEFDVVARDRSVSRLPTPQRIKSRRPKELVCALTSP